MRTKALVLAAMLAAPVTAHARQWYVVSLDGNRCLNYNEVQQETIMNGGSMLWATPEQLIYVLRYYGMTPDFEVHKLKGGDEYVFVRWRTLNGDMVFRVFSTNLPLCEKAVGLAIKRGEVPAPGDLR